MKYRIEFLIHWYGTDAPEHWEYGVDYTDERNVPMHKAQWLGLFLSFYGLVINTETGKIEYSIGAINPDWIKWALESYFESLPFDKEAIR